jgi:hypothetical protein
VVAEAFFDACAERGEPTDRSYHALFWLDLARHNASTTSMPTRTDEQLPWDEGAALEELERLQRGIHEWRSRRKDVQTEFDRFVRGFRTSAPTPEPDRATSERPAATSNASRLAEYPSENAPTAPLPVALSTVDAPAAPVSIAPLVAPPASGVSKTTAGNHRTRAIWFGTAAAVVLAGLVVKQSWFGAADEPPVTRASATPATAASAPVAPRPAANQPPAAPPSAAPAAASEIVAVRGVWVRVVVDGVKAVERELRAGEHVPLAAGRTAVIRAGDAGSLRLTIDGQDRGTLGPEGEVITRTIRTPPAADR